MKIIKFKIFFLATIFCGILLFASSCSEDTTQIVTTKFEKFMADEFEVEGAPNPENWTFDIVYKMGI
jgi:hypothetical protein